MSLTHRLLLVLLATGSFLFGQQPGPFADYPIPSQVEEYDANLVPPPVEANPIHAGDYVLGDGDRIQVWVRDSEEISSRPYLVANGGTVNLPLLGRVDIEGLTVAELEFHLELELKKYLREPEAIVTVTEYRSSPAYVFGAVRRPGLTELRGPRTLIEVISMVGGLTGDASNTVLVTRRLEYGALPVPWAEIDVDEQFSVAEIDLDSIIKGRSSVGNVVIRPFDLVVIPKLDAIYVTGEVRRPGPVTSYNGERVTALQAISMSGGFTEYAKVQDAKVMRPIMGGPDRYDIPVNMKAVMNGSVRDFPLQPGDMLIVPGKSRLKVRLLQSIAQSVVGATVNAGILSVIWGRSPRVR